MFTRLFERLSGKRNPDHARLLGDAVMRLLDEHGVLTVDRKLLHTLKASRKEFFRVVYGLVMRESMYMMADAEGKVILMTNAEYSRFMMRRSVSRETEIRRRDGAPVVPEIAANANQISETEGAFAKAAPAGLVAAAAPAGGIIQDILCSDTDTALFTGATLGGAPLDGVIAISPEVSESSDSAAINNINTTAFPAHLIQGEAEPSTVEYAWLTLDAKSGKKKGEILPEGRQSLPGRRRGSRLVAEPAGGNAK